MFLRRIAWVGTLAATVLALWLGGLIAWRKDPAQSRYRSEFVAALEARPAPGRLQGLPYLPEASTKLLEPAERQALLRVGRAMERELGSQTSPQAWADRALVRLAAGRPDEAARLLEASVSVASQDKTRFLSDLAVAYLARNEMLHQPRDLTLALEAASLAAEGDPGMSEACFNRALALDRLHLVFQAAAVWQNCFSRELDPAWKQEIARHLAVLRKSLDHPAKAMKVLTESARPDELKANLKIWERAFLAGRRLDSTKAAVRILGFMNDDIVIAEVLEGVARESGRSTGPHLATLAQAVTRFIEARNLFLGHSFAHARFLFEQARISFVTAESSMQAWAQLGVISCDFYQDDFDAVVEKLRAMQPDVARTRFPALAAHWHWIKGMTHSRRGNLRAALNNFEVTADFFDKTGKPENMAAGYQLLGEMYRLLGNEDRAWHYRMRSLALLRDKVSSRRRFLLLRDASESLLAEGNSRATLAFLNEAFHLPSVSPQALAEMLMWRARALTHLGDFEAAETDLQEARSQVMTIDGVDLQQRALADIDFAEADLESRRNPERAYLHFNRLADTYRTKGHVLPLGKLLLHWARLARKLRLFTDEQAALEEGIEIFERQWRSLQVERDRVSFLETSQELYDARIALAVEQGDPVAALEFSERARVFKAGSAGLPRASWVHSLAAVPPERVPCLAHRQAILPENTVVLEYALTDDRLFLWMLRCDGVRFIDFPVTTASMNDLARRFREAARIESAEPKLFHELAAVAYDILLRKVVSHIPSGAKLIIVPDKALFEIPFAALRDRVTGRFLIQDYEIAYTPSATHYLKSRGRPAMQVSPGDVLLVSPLDPDLKDSEEEIEDLRHLYAGARVLTGPAAHRKAFLQALDRYRILHYAGHAELHPSDPLQSRLPLASAEDSVAVTVRDLQGQTFEHLDLVILSACNSVAAKPTRSGGFFGLARPFLAGGVSAVVGTLWDIDDSASRSVLVAFHRELSAGLSPAAALRSAQLRHLEQGWPPAAWAAFALVGREVALPIAGKMISSRGQPSPASPATF